MASSVDIDSTVVARSLPRRERAILRHADWRTMAFKGRFDRHAAVTAACVSLSPRVASLHPTTTTTTVMCRVLPVPAAAFLSLLLLGAVHIFGHITQKSYSWTTHPCYVTLYNIYLTHPTPRNVTYNKLKRVPRKVTDRTRN